MKSFVKRNEDRDIKRKKLFLDKKKAIIRNELYVKIIRNNEQTGYNKRRQRLYVWICRICRRG